VPSRIEKPLGITKQGLESQFESRSKGIRNYFQRDGFLADL